MTCQVVRVAKMDEGEVEAAKELTEGETWRGIMANLHVEVTEVEEVISTLDDQQMVSRGVEDKWKTRQKLRN